MLNKFANYIEKNNLLNSEQKVLLAVSGGLDSMVMLDLFEKSGFNYSVVHCNFQLRGNESDMDESFVKDYVDRRGVPLYLKRFETEEHAKIYGISIEMAARELRYNFFDELIQEHKFSSLATAHHQDDQIETFFINLIRKTGIKGLSGIKAKSGHIIRPLLFTNRKEIREYAVQNDIPFREDSSNNSMVYWRNFIRHNILPKFEELSPAFRSNVLASIQNLNDVEKVYLNFIDFDKEKVSKFSETNTIINIEQLLDTQFPKLLLYELLSEFRFNATVVDEIFECLNEESGKQFYSATHRLIKDRKELIIESIKSAKEELFYIEKDDIELFKPIQIQIDQLDVKNFKIPSSQTIACLDFDKLIFPLIIKKWKHGEYFQPLGMEGLKKLSDFFIDEKLSIPEKEETWILYSANKVAWIIGKRIDNRFKITKQTKTVYKLEVIKTMN